MTFVSIRPASIEDLDDLDQIERAVFSGDRLSRRSLRYYVGSDTASFLVLRHGTTIAGDAIVAFRQGSAIARLYSIAITAEFAGQGFGRKLLEACEEAVLSRGRTALRLEVRHDNPAAIALYQRSGYRQFGTYPDYYEDGATALRFEKNLADKSSDAKGGPRA